MEVSSSSDRALIGTWSQERVRSRRAATVRSVAFRPAWPSHTTKVHTLVRNH
jgi:hypothetical protein